MNRKHTLGALLAGCCIVVACAGTSFEWESARQITAGMSEAQLTQLMGPPMVVRSTPEGQVWVWSYANGFTGSARSVAVVLKDGAVVSAPSVPQGYR